MRGEISVLMQDVVRSWHRVRCPRGRTLEEIVLWLETNVTGRYWWDVQNITGTMDRIWFESQEDADFARMVWDDHQ